MKKLVVICALAALAQETRLDIFRLLVQKDPEGLPAGKSDALTGCEYDEPDRESGMRPEKHYRKHQNEGCKRGPA
jgi:hypothetical protein